MKNVLTEEQLTSRAVSRGEDVRSPYFRDQTAIIHSMPFRRLKHKTQFLFAPENDHICTRIEHVLHVATIAATAGIPWPIRSCTLVAVTVAPSAQTAVRTGWYFARITLPVWTAGSVG